MPGKSVPLSVRVSDDDAVFLAALEIDDAVTPSEKLRALLHEAQRRNAGLKDASEGGMLLRDMAASARRGIRKSEGHLKRKSDLVLKLYERVPDIMAKLIAGIEDIENTEELIQFERELMDQTAVLIKDFMALGLSKNVRVYDPETYKNEIEPVLELVELVRHHQKKATKE